MLNFLATYPLTVPLLTGLLALLGSWFGSNLGRNTEHRQWLRDQKQEAYLQFMQHAKQLADDLLQRPEELDFASVDRLMATRSSLRLVGAPDVRLAARDLDVHLSKTWGFITYAAPEPDPDPDPETWEWSDEEDAFHEEVRKMLAELEHLFVIYLFTARKDLNAHTRKDRHLDRINRSLFVEVDDRVEGNQIPASFRRPNQGS